MSLRHAISTAQVTSERSMPISALVLPVNRSEM